MKTYLIIIVLLISNLSYSQVKSVTQEDAAQKALQEYEKNNPPKDTMPFPAPAENQQYFGSRITRTVTLLASSSKYKKWPVKILYYGQSIVGSRNFSECLTNYLTEKFPFADLTVENRAIGGFSGNRIIRTAWHDVYPYYPDLVIFHVYGGEDHGELEQLFTNIRKYTTAEILLFNHHINGDRKTYDEKSYQYLNYIANKYNCELVNVSKEWSRYLSDNNLQPKELLRDNVHPNRNGYWVLAQMIGRHFNYNSLFPTFWQDRIKTVYLTSAYDVNGVNQINFPGKKWEIIDGVPVGKVKDEPIELTFTGNRVDVIAVKLKKQEATGSAQILVDGKPIQKNKKLYTITRPSAGPNTWFPLLKRVSHTKDIIPEKWTLKVEEINADSTVWFFSVTGSKTGFDGKGRSDQSFSSKSGRVVIDQSDYMFADIKKIFKTATPVGFECTWEVMPTFIETYKTPAFESKYSIYKTKLVQGLENGPHTLTLIPNGDGLLPIEAFEVHHPDM